MNAPQQHASAAVHSSDSLPRPVVERDASTRRERSQPALKLPPVDPEPRAYAALASLVSEVAGCVGAASSGSLAAVVERCNAALEASLESQRGALRADDPVALREELRGLARLLGAADRPSAPLVMRQIRRVLGRLDALGAE